MVPSSFMISQITPAGLSPANLQRSTDPSVWPVRTSTPPFLARSGKMCPGVQRSLGPASSAMAARMVSARSEADMPVVTLATPSMETVNAVPKGAVLSRTIMLRPSWATFSSVSGRQINPRPHVAMKLMASGVTFSAAMVRSPSFSRFWSSIRMTILPSRISSRASSMVATGMGS